MLFVCQGKDFGQKSRLFIEIRHLSCQNSDLNLDSRSREEGWAIWSFIVVQCSHSILRQYNRIFSYLWRMEYSWEACIKRQHQFPSKLGIWSGLSSKIEKIFCNCSCKGIAHCSKMKHPLFKLSFFSYNPCPLTGWTDFFFPLGLCRSNIWSYMHIIVEPSSVIPQNSALPPPSNHSNFWLSGVL